MAKRKELWRTLKVGDRVRLVEMPPEFLQPGYGIHSETLETYEWLLKRGRSLRVYKIDDWGLPWVQCSRRLKDGSWEYHSLAVNHDGVAKVQSRK